MNKYESVIIIDPTLEEAEIKDVITKFTDLINNDGKVENVEERGVTKLAYDVKKHSEGYYVVFTFEANPEHISELERIYRITDSVLKFLTVRKDA